MKICSLSGLFFVVALLLPLCMASRAHAIENPLDKPNNKFGIHVLFDSEIEEAARLVNSSGGEWGYVVIPIQAGDRDLEKWQAFMDRARKLKIIPIIRLATEGDYFNTKVWRKPKEEDVLDFANFLNSLSWPVQNQYVIVFNEVNRNDEWGGKADPKEYAQLLSYASIVLKSLSANFFVLNSGFDNASVNGYGAINKMSFLERMEQSVPGIFNQIDGFVSHAYPNPGFSQPPSSQHTSSIASFRFERARIKQFTNKTLPIFITETGWSSKNVSDDTRVSYYREAFETVWNDPDIVAVAPFLLLAGVGPFEAFSFLTGDGKPTMQYEAYHALPKLKGEPTQRQQILGLEEAKKTEVPSLWFPEEKKERKISVSETATDMFHWLFHL